MFSYFSPSIMTVVVDDLRYSKSHEWAKVEGDTVVVGITHHAQVCIFSVKS